MEFIDIWSYLTSAVTLLMFLTGLSPCVNMYRSKSTHNIPYNIFLLNAVSCLGMFHYGLMITNGMLIFLYAVGTFLELLYVVLFLLVARPKAKPLMFLCLACLYDAGLYWYMYTRLQDTAERAYVLGSCSSLLTSLITSLPALEVIGNVQQKNADGMPLSVLLASIACCFCWLVYGLMLNNPYIYMPNIPGIVTGVMKLYVIYLYADKTKTD